MNEECLSGLHVSTSGLMVLGVWLGLYSGPTFAQSTSSVAPELSVFPVNNSSPFRKPSRLIAEIKHRGGGGVGVRQGQNCSCSMRKVCEMCPVKVRAAITVSDLPHDQAGHVGGGIDVDGTRKAGFG